MFLLLVAIYCYWSLDFLLDRLCSPDSPSMCESGLHPFITPASSAFGSLSGATRSMWAPAGGGRLGAAAMDLQSNRVVTKRKSRRHVGGLRSAARTGITSVPLQRSENNHNRVSTDTGGARPCPILAGDLATTCHFSDKDVRSQFFQVSLGHLEQTTPFGDPSALTGIDHG